MVRIDECEEEKILSNLYRLLLTFNATSLLLIVYQVKDPIFWEDVSGLCLILLYAAYLAVPILLTGVSIFASRWLSQDSFNAGDVKSIEHANNSFLPSYLGYFFVALSVPNVSTLAFVYATLFAFTFKSQALYFNPLFLLYGYSFYDAQTKRGTAVFLIAKADYRLPAEIEVPDARRINGYTFLERR